MDMREAVLKLFSGKISLALIEFLSIALFSQYLGTGPLGSFFVFQAIIGIIGIPSNFGVTRAAEKQLSANEPQGKVISSSILMVGLLLIPWVFGFIILEPFIEQYVGINGVLPLVVLGLIVAQARELSIHFLSGQLSVEKTPLLKVIGKVVWLSTGLILIYYGWGNGLIILSFIIGDITIILGAILRLDLVFGKPDIHRMRSLISFGRYVFIGSLGGFVYSWMDVAILRIFVSPSLIGAYEIAWRVASLSMMLTQAIRTSLFPQISHWHTEGCFEKIESAYNQWLQLPFYLTIPAFTGSVVLGKDILETLFSIDLEIAYFILLIFMLEKILRSIYMILGPALYAMDKPELGYRGSIAAVATNLILNIILIPLFGLIGAAIATSISALVAAVINLSYVNNIISIKPRWKNIGWCIVSASIMAVGVKLIRPVLPQGLLLVLSGVFTGIVFYLIVLLSSERIRIEIISILGDRSRIFRTFERL
ncbi:MAG: lipopolysaccharide biosynthesis protein [Halobacteriaceae archaeon]